MIDNDKWCDSWEYAYQQHCNAKVYWQSNKFCQYSCFVQGVGYDGDLCCPEDTNGQTQVLSPRADDGQ
jgi:hypothetical protein